MTTEPIRPPNQTPSAQIEPHSTLRSSASSCSVRVQDIGNGFGDNTAKKAAGYALEVEQCHGTEKASGSIGITSREIPISKALRGWHVGRKVTGFEHYAVCFGKPYTGEIDMETE